jgi:4-azaleucine resistance transporter AzlC
VAQGITTPKQEFSAGVRATLPLIAGAIPFGIIFGAIGVNNGLSPAGTLGMSLFVFAGSAQFIAAGLVGAGAAAPIIILTTFIVNLRHALYSASLAPYMNHLPQRWLLPLGFWLTDESYAVTIKRYIKADDAPYKHWFFFGSAVAMYTNWQICTLIGVIAGSAFEDAASWGLDFAMVVTFIGIVVPLIITHPMLIAVIVAGSTAVLFDGLPNKIGLFIAAACGITAGYFAETYAINQESASRD